jgi:hypothetical protein
MSCKFSKERRKRMKCNHPKYVTSTFLEWEMKASLYWLVMNRASFCCDCGEDIYDLDLVLWR